MRLDAKECEGPPGERNVLEMQYIRYSTSSSSKYFQQQQSVFTKMCSDLFVVKEIIRINI